MNKKNHSTLNTSSVIYWRDTISEQPYIKNCVNNKSVESYIF